MCLNAVISVPSNGVVTYHLLCLCLSAATNKYWVLSGQHRLQATLEFRAKLESAGEPIPEWCKVARCHCTVEGLSKDQLQLLAGRLQAQSSAIIPLSFETTMRRCLDEIKEYRDKHSVVEPPYTDVLRTTFLKTGKSIINDGKPVCIFHCDSAFFFFCFLFCIERCNQRVCDK